MAIDHRALKALNDELNSIPLTGKTAAEKERENRLKVLIPCVRSGMPYRDIQLDRLNDLERTSNMPVTSFEQPSEQRTLAEEWHNFFHTGEFRDQKSGGSQPQYLTGVGSTVERFWGGVKADMKAADPLCNGDLVQLVETAGGNPLQAGILSDTESAAEPIVLENQNLAASETDIASTSAVDVFAHSFRNPMWRISIESLTDLEGMISAIQLFSLFTSSRLARGIGRSMLLGTGGANNILGLLPSLAVLGAEAEACIATGSASNTGGNETGSNSVGSFDLATALGSLDPLYQMNASWLMNPATLTYIAGLVSKMGTPCEIVKFVGSQPYILGRPVYQAPSMPGLTAMSQSVLVGDFKFWMSRHANGLDKIRLVKENPGLIENGEVGLITAQRWDGALLYNSANGTCPIRAIVQHT